MKESIGETIGKIHRLGPEETLLLARIYLHKDYPHFYMTIGGICRFLQASEGKVIPMVRKLEEMEVISSVRSSVKFIYPVQGRKDRDFIKYLIAQKIGLK